MSDRLYLGDEIKKLKIYDYVSYCDRFPASAQKKWRCEYMVLVRDEMSLLVRGMVEASWCGGATLVNGCNLPCYASGEDAAIPRIAPTPL